MRQQNLIVFNLPVLFDVLNEIKDNFNFKISKIDSKNDFQKMENFSFENSLILTDKQNEIKEIRNQLVLNEFPLEIKHIVENININLLKIKFNNQSEIIVKDFKINLNSREIFLNKEKIRLTEKEIEIILFLHYSNKDQSVANLKKEVWQHKSDLETHTVETHIYRLRKKIFNTFSDQNFLISKKEGYLINLKKT